MIGVVIVCHQEEPGESLKMKTYQVNIGFSDWVEEVEAKNSDEAEEIVSKNLERAKKEEDWFPGSFIADCQEAEE